MGVGDDRAKATRGEGAAVRSHNRKSKNQGSVDIFVPTPFHKASLDTLVGEQIAGILVYLPHRLRSFALRAASILSRPRVPAPDMEKQ